MAKLTLTDISSGYSSVSVINANNALIETALENTLSRDGTSPNQMNANLDMNSYRVTNLVTAVSNDEPVTLGQANTLAGVTNPLTQDSVAAVLWPQTAAETTAVVTPTNYQYEPGDVRRYGATLDGVADDTTALQAAMDQGFVLPWEGTLLIDAVNTSVQTAIRGNGRNSIIKFDTPSTAETPGVTLSNAGSSIEGVHINGADTERSLVKVTAADCTVHITGEQVDAGASTTDFQSGIDIYANNCTFSIYGEDFTNTGRSNESIPRLVSVQSTSDNYRGYTVAGKDVNTGVIIGASTVQGHVDNILLENAADNGIYQLGGDGFSFGTLDYRGNQEACVCAGGATTGDKIVTRTQGTSALNIDDATSVHIGLIEVQYDGTNSMDSFIRARSTNGTSGIVQVDAMRGTIRGGNLMDFANGTTERLSIYNVDVEFIYDAVVSDAITSWANLSGLKGFDFRNWHVKIIDEDNALTGSNYFQMVLPTTNLSRESFFSNVRVVITNADEVTTSSGYLRIVSLAQDEIHSDGVCWQANIGPHGREATYGPVGTSNAVPTAGEWKRGQILYDKAPSAGGALGWVCVSAGTPGTWVPFGGIEAANAYTPTNVSTDRAFDADTVAVAELADVVGTLIADLQGQGLLK